MQNPANGAAVQHFSWDDVEVFLAVAEAGTFSAAARRLGIDGSTVGRRVGALEADLGVALFLRTPAGPRLTPEGRDLLEPARAARAELTRMFGRTRVDEQPHGVVRLASSFMFAAVAPQLPRLYQQHPGLRLEVVVGPETVDIPGGGADLALRLRRLDSPVASATSIARRVGTAAFSPWASPAWRKAHPGPLGSPGQTMLGFAPEAPFEPGADMQARLGLPVIFRGNRMPTVAEAVQAGLGFAVMPDPYMKASWPQLQVIGPPEFDVGLWVVMRPEMRRSARIRAVADWLASIDWDDPLGSP